MKISIITACFNSAATIADCIRSVNEQTYANIEHIIVDGASKDNTLELIRNMPNRVGKIISEPDKGIYEAMNKGIAMSSGEIVGLLNSDDFYRNKHILAEIEAVFSQDEVDCVFGDVNYVNAKNPQKIVRRWHSGPFQPNSFRRGWHPAHPAFFLRRKVYGEYGSFNQAYHLAADFELMLRMLEKYRIRNKYIDRPLIDMRLGGATSGSLKNIFLQNIECYKAFRENGMPVSVLYPIYRLVPKLKQFFT